MHSLVFTKGETNREVFGIGHPNLNNLPSVVRVTVKVMRSFHRHLLNLTGGSQFCEQHQLMRVISQSLSIDS